jgi:FkbM family methyltransferase
MAVIRKAVFYFRLALQAALGRLQKAWLGNNIVGVVTRSENGVFIVDIEDRSVGKELRDNGQYGQDELKRIFQHVDGTGNVLVVGAHLGALVVPIAKHCKAVVAIEANPDTFGLLKSNLLLNEVANVRAHNIAASDKTEKLEFVVSRSNSGGSKRMPKVRAFEYFYDAPETVVVEARSLDAYLGGEQFNLVFMDIEGSEYFALKGMQEILKNAKTLFVEYLPHHLKNVSGVSPKEFLTQIEPHFEKLFIPSKNLHVGKSGFRSALQTMFDLGQEDDGLIFAK